MVAMEDHDGGEVVGEVRQGEKDRQIEDKEPHHAQC